MNKKFSALAKPYLVWLYILAVLPAAFMFVMMFLDTEGVDFNDLHFTLKNFANLDSSTIVAFFNSLLLAALATIFCILAGYLISYRIYRSKIKNKFLILVILILPMWNNLLLRTEALASIMEPNNILADLLTKIVGHEVTFPAIRGTNLAVIIGLIVTYVPFMVMPVYNALEKIDPSVEEAALDLGLTNFKKFFKVVLPLSSKGIVTGSIMVFLPCLSGFAVPEILSNGQIVMIGNIIEQRFRNLDYNMGSLLAIIVLVIILFSIFIVNKVDKEGETLL